MEIGDVFAYQFKGEYSKLTNFYDKYIVFRKVSEDTCWPGHIIPVIQVYKWIGEEIPQLESLKSKELLIQNFVPETLNYKPDIKPEYLVQLITTSKKDIPCQLTYLGNIHGDDLIEFRGHHCYLGYIGIGWEGKGYNNSFEKYMIDQYIAWIK